MATPIASGRRLRSIQGLRGAAVVCIVLYHIGTPIGSAFISLDTFFVISGFVITRLVLSMSAETTRLSLRDFWAARVRRLAPALGVAILLTLILSVPFASPAGVQADTGITGIASIAWLANGALSVLTLGYFTDGAAQNPLLHMWSLAVEEQFYIVFPLIVVAVLWWVRRRGGKDMVRPFAVVVGALTALSFTASVLITYANLPFGLGSAIAYYAPFTRAWEFGAGALVALVPIIVTRQRGRWIAVAGFAIFVVGLIVTDDRTTFPGYIAILPVVGAALLCFSTISYDGAILSSRFLVWVGDRSYGWYLFHWPLIVLTAEYVTAPVAALIGLALAHLSLKYVENPIRRKDRWPNLSAPRLWLVTGAPVIAASALLMVATSHHWWNQSVETYAESVSRGEHPVQSRCQSLTPLTVRDMSSCTFGPSNDSSPIILIGDSSAGMYADMAVVAAEKAGHRITIASIPSCQVADLGTGRPKLSRAYLINCPGRYDDTIKWLSKQPPSTVIIASGSGIPDLKDFSLVAANKRVYTGGGNKQDAWASSLERAYTAIENQGHHVAAVELTPQWAEPDGTGWSPRDCNLIDVLHDRTTCERHVSRSTMDRQQRHTLAATREAAKATGVTVIDVRDILCADGKCGTSRDGVGLYSDSAHLTPAGADKLKPRFVELMSRPPR